MSPNERNPEPDQKTLLEWATRLCPDTPRSRLKDWIRAGRFRLDGEPVTRAGERLSDPGDRLTLGQPDGAAAAFTDRKRIHPRLGILYLDGSLAVLDKGEGLLSVPAPGSREDSALGLLGTYLNDSRSTGLRRRLFSGRPAVEPLPVHRLDQYTSGLFCVAFDPEAREVLINQLRRHELVREYVAFADGLTEEKAGTWRHYLRLDDKGYRQSLSREPVEGAVEAVAHFRVEREFPRSGVTRLRIRLESGLKHQIRIQAAAEGLPLVGDRLFHPKAHRDSKGRHAPLPHGLERQALHAAMIAFRHPVTGRELRFEAPLPPDLARMQGRLA